MAARKMLYAKLHFDTRDKRVTVEFVLCQELPMEPVYCRCLGTEYNVLWTGVCFENGM